MIDVEIRVKTNMLITGNYERTEEGRNGVRQEGRAGQGNTNNKQTQRGQVEGQPHSHK